MESLGIKSTGDIGSLILVLQFRYEISFVQISSGVDGVLLLIKF
jgi:hypothetical protein